MFKLLAIFILEEETKNIMNQTQLIYKGIELFFYPKNFDIYRISIESIFNPKNETK